MEIVKATGERVRKTALAILDQLDTAQVGDGTPPGLDRETPQRNQPSQEWTALARSASGRQVKPVPETVPRPAASAAVMQGRGL